MRVAADVFDRYCARCHGDGPEASAPDLSQLWRRYGSPLPTAEIASFIDGTREVAAHGPREMPVWGEELYHQLPDTDTVKDMRAGTIALLVEYLQTIQTGPATGTP
jgi:mono/diheme cytochrome c family protein